jgi:hypothetical protein
MARWKPPVSAAALEAPPRTSPSACDVETVASTASASAPPTCAVVFTSPDASPASCGVAPDIARFISAGKQTPAPAPSSAIAGRRLLANAASAGACANSTRPATSSASPAITVLRVPKRIASRSA